METNELVALLTETQKDELPLLEEITCKTINTFKEKYTYIK